MDDGGPWHKAGVTAGGLMARRTGFGLLALFVLTAAAPRSVTIRTGVGACCPSVNGRRLSLRQLEATIRRWHPDATEVHFQPSERTRYACVEAVLTVLKRSGVGKMGFIGNETLTKDRSQ